MSRWGVVSTIKAPAREVLDFAAYHLDLGADHLFIYLDNDTPKAYAALDAHPKVTVQHTDKTYWQTTNGRKPAKHQLRQTLNATHAYDQAEAMGLDWLGHIDVDEFLCPALDFRAALAALPPNIKAARIAPAETMTQDGQTGLDPKAVYCKAWEPNTSRRQELETALYPTFGLYLRGGFVSHTLGKSFLRTGLGPLTFKIHRAMHESQEIGPSQFLTGVDLCHRHIKSWESWQKSFAYRLEKGSYRAELQSVRPGDPGGLSMHQLFTLLMEEKGEDALRAFFNEICLARPDLLQGLEARGLLRVYYLALDEKRERIFPGWRDNKA
ncbi:MAG: glycosyltransferase family 2 protein [Rhodobacteraceae bacterium]|nr:glycosyltransferase family 2 protein [Paracoccaceae bacterium]MCW9044280.1 glycosyltransferase family 2 protein [Pseudopelagicola sp.]